MKFIVQDPIQTLKNDYAGGVTKQQQTVKLKLLSGDNKIEDGISLKSDTEFVIYIADLAKFGQYQSGQAYEMTLKAVG